MRTGKVEEKISPIYKPVKLAPFGQKIYDFCQEFPAVVFNAPADYQKEFQAQHAELIADVKYDHCDYLRRSGQFFYENKPVNDFLKKIEQGTFLLFLTMGEESCVTVVARVEDLYRSNDIPITYRIDFHKTKGFKKHVGGVHVWSAHIMAVAAVDGLQKEMAVLDPSGEIFFAKARKHAVTVEEYYQRNIRVEVIATDCCFKSSGGQGLVDNQIFRVIKVFGGKTCYPGTKDEIRPGMLIDKHSLAILVEKGEVVF